MRLHAIIAVALAAVGCADSSALPERFSVWDSAGILITESSSPQWAVGTPWTLSPEPEVVIGRVEGDERYLLSGVHGARRFADGRIAVLDAGSSRVRVYDAAGDHLFDVGGRGDGPSEFSSAHFFDLVHDSIVVYEYAPGSLTWFSPQGEFVRTEATPTRSSGQGLRGTTVGFMGDHSGVATTFPLGPRPNLIGIHRSPLSIWRYDLRGATADSLIEIQDDEEDYFESDGRLAWRDLSFGDRTYVTTSDDWIYVGSTEAYAIELFDRSGQLRRIVRRAVDPVPVTAGHLERYAEQLAVMASVEPDALEAFKRRVREGTAAEDLPHFRLILTDADQNLWVEDWHDVGLGQGPYSVFGPDGAWLGTVELPPGMPRFRGINLRTALLEIGTDYVLGVWEDDLGVEQVRLYRLLKG